MNTEDILLGAIAGDIIGSVYEFSPVKEWNFPLFTEASKFTDDTVMTIANADWLLTGDSLLGIMQDYGNRYPLAGYGSSFIRWLWADDPQPYNSWGNGSAMRVSPVGWAFDTLEETLVAAKRSAEVTHNHPEGIKGAQATAACVFLARTSKSKQEIKKYVEETFGYNLDRTCNEIRATYSYDISCQGTVPESIIAFLESTDYESAIRLTISLRGDADTMGAVSIEFFKIVQNKLHFAAHGHTAAEVIYERADANRHMMGLTSFKGDHPTLRDAKIAKNYLSEEDLKVLNNLVSGYFDFAEVQAMKHRTMYMKDYIQHLDAILSSTGEQLLNGCGTVSHGQAMEKAEKEYRKFDVRTLSPVEQAYLDNIKILNKKVKGKK